MGRREGTGSLGITVTTVREGAMEPTDLTEPVGDTSAAETDTDDLVDDELLVEEISIDGMCGVY